MAEAALVVTALAAVGGAVYQKKQADEVNKAQKEQGRIERRAAELANARNARRAIAARRMQQAEITAQSANTGTGMETSSAVRGAVGSLNTQTAANIGFANTQLASSWAAQRAGERGAQRAARAGSIANTFAAAGQIASSFGAYKATQTPGTVTLSEKDKLNMYPAAWQ